VAFFATTGLILGAAYSLWLYRRVVFGELVKEDLKSILDLEWREIAIFAPLVLMTVWMGVYPGSFLDLIGPSVEKLIANYQTALGGAKAAALSLGR
jgi:NADH-quinone oxidoreductase subunit M